MRRLALWTGSAFAATAGYLAEATLRPSLAAQRDM
jgi:hypothetical protein